MTALIAKKANYLYEVGAFLKRTYPTLHSWQLENPNEDVLKEAYFYVHVQDHGSVHRLAIRNTIYEIGFEIVNGDIAVSIESKVSAWIKQNADALLQNNSYTFQLNETDPHFVNALVDSIAKYGYDVVKTNDSTIHVEKLD